MSAGLPGLGLGGLFFILSALLAPLVEFARTLQGRSSAAAWRQVGRQFAIALTIIATVELVLRGVVLLASALGGGGGDPGLIVVPLRPLGITTGLLVAVLASAKLLQLAMRVRRLRRPRFAPTGGVQSPRTWVRAKSRSFESSTRTRSNGCESRTSSSGSTSTSPAR
ncbi:MAG: hypothetical protein ACHQJ5_02430 [Vicinamibacteria bacterium]|jgi:hypothetical protein